MSFESGKVIVCDNGTGYTKCGFAGTNSPHSVFPTIIGRPLLSFDERINNVHLKDLMIGDDVVERRPLLEVSYPVSGSVRDWEGMQHLWDYTFSEKLCINPNECKIMLTETPLTPSQYKNQLMSIMFEKYGFRACYVANQAALSLSAHGLLTGLVIDSGDSCTNVVPIYDGYPLPMSSRVPVGGRDVTRYLLMLLNLSGYTLNRTADFDVVNRIKEEYCYIGYDFGSEHQLSQQTAALVKSYTLPDGQVIKIEKERFHAPEALFNPHLIWYSTIGISEAVFHCIRQIDAEYQLEFYKHIVLSGGSTLFPGFASRLEKETRDNYLSRVLKGDKTRLGKFVCRVEDHPHRKHLVFLGGALVAEVMKNNDTFWINKKDYDEIGENIFHKT